MSKRQAAIDAWRGLSEEERGDRIEGASTLRQRLTRGWSVERTLTTSTT